VSGHITESVVEEAALGWLEELGWQVRHGPEIAVGERGAERTDPGYRDVVLEGRLRAALARLNPGLPPQAVEDAFRKLTRLDAPSLIARNHAAHRMLVDGITVEFARPDGSIAGAIVRAVDFDEPDANDWLAVSQFAVAEGQALRRPDVVLFVNGLPLAVIELKNPADEAATAETAMRQLQTYQHQIPALFATNEALVASDGTTARIGALGAGLEWFKPWRTIDGSRRRPPLEEDGRLPPVPRGERRGRGDASSGGREPDRGDARGLRRGHEPGRRPRRPARRGGLAHAGLRQEPDDGVLCRPGDPRAGDGEPDDRRPHGPQ
jgi:type I restriction enzyme R subunit